MMPEGIPAAFLVRPYSRRRQTGLQQTGLDVRRICSPGRGLPTASTAKTLRRNPVPATDAAKARQTREEAAAPRWATPTAAAAGAGAGPTPLPKTLIYL